ncbi:LiaI-LiaF-like domain-containing protein [Piscinibacter koreensis]|uniref:LiaI-LiaF-like transmembrane region domain-containing protein n=1 Tax=Piscinibacter koreensis TaxID=2742824 RepID=A0A7Y6TW65_9BURK|nr:DUF5668 domain-containing protein [Schlegelella koreensis]NUZ05676.1 hypothetical protein [Schlegelella koreensis]
MNKSGLILITLGLLFLAMNFGLVEWGWLRQWWPLILIAVGLVSVLKRDRGARRSAPPPEESRR